MMSGTHISVINKHYLKFQITQWKSEYQIHKQLYDTLKYDTAPLNHNLVVSQSKCVQKWEQLVDRGK